MNSEEEIREAIEALRDRTENTQELYREACALLFFRYGITPTANKLYQLVRKGSMSAPAEALTRFWAELREKSRVRIEHPDLPDALKEAAGDLVGRLWRDAQSVAHENLAAFRDEAQVRVAAAETATQSAEQAYQDVKKDLAQMQTTLDAASERNLLLERTLAAERTEKDGLSGLLSVAREERQALESELARTRGDFASELDKQRAALRRAEDRHEAAEKHLLLELDRERTGAAKVQKELAQVREANAALIERQRDEVRTLQRDLGDFREKLGIAEGSLLKMRERAAQDAADSTEMREQLSRQTIENAVLRRELELSGEKVKEMELQMREMARRRDPATTSKMRKPAKPKSSSPVARSSADGTAPPGKR